MPEWLTVENVIAVVTAVVTLASVIAAITPTDKDNKFIAKVMGLVNALAVNVGNAKNKE